jgi:hypothetical protein
LVEAGYNNERTVAGVKCPENWFAGGLGAAVDFHPYPFDPAFSLIDVTEKRRGKIHLMLMGSGITN